MSEQTDYRAIVERIAVILHGKVTDIDLLTVTVLAMKERNSRLERQRDEQPAPVVPERDQVRTDHAKWSQATFGSVGPVGPLKHLSKEALEAADAPGDLSEWADMQFLLWDAQRRAGITDEQITQAMIDKLKVNKARQWPEPKDGEPRQHIQADTAPPAPPAPVVPAVRAEPVSDDELNAALRLHRLNVEGHSQLSDAFRAGFRYARRTAPPAPVVVPEEMPKGLAGQIVSLLAHNIGDKFLAQKIWNACRAAIAAPGKEG